MGQRVEQVYWPFKDIADPDDSDYAPRGAACVKISDALGRVGVNDAGLYAFGSSDVDLPALPGLVVCDAGIIPIPLADSFASCLLDRCTRVEEGDSTRWELAADKLWLKNPEWNRKIGDLGVALGEKLGFQDVLLDGGIRSWRTRKATEGR
ncbi:hypothetical protein GN244_ATG00316 [Phytophthora infestans]|uniref:Uncharacterized protein n=1 Tax=Phytophthora infestans TaxID=4787 RepID=A0A833TCM5_PHYIN|nr:hypothetical protein GN244_ATG00316 [Phytophthora infestans]